LFNLPLTALDDTPPIKQGPTIGGGLALVKDGANCGGYSGAAILWPGVGSGDRCP
jgi:hypothetical protein